MDFGGILVVLSAVIAGFLGGCLSGFIGGYLSGGIQGWKVDSIERRMVGSYAASISQKGVEGKANKEARFNEAFVRAAALHKEGMDTMQIIKTLLPEYPDVAADVAKKVMNGKDPLKGLGL